jgi:hypothetical protein
MARFVLNLDIASKLPELAYLRGANANSAEQR